MNTNAETPKRIFLIDGTAFAFRSFYAIRTGLTDTKGRPTNAVYGFTRILLKLLREHAPTHIAVAFDAGGTTFRDEMFEAYKAHREKTPEELCAQFPMMIDVVEALQIPVLRIEGVEADDVLGTLARRAEAQGMEAIIVTGDKDMLQLITDHIHVYDPNKGDKGQWYSAQDVQERFGVGPQGVIDALSLMGDSADNVPGVRGIGEKRAKELMEAYGSLDAVYEHLDELKGKLKENLLADREIAYLSKRLVTIDTDVPLPVDPDACHRQEPDRDRLTSVFAELAFQSMLEEILPRAEEEEKLDYRLILTQAELDAALAEMRASGCFAVDTETTSVDPVRADLVGVSMSCRAKTGYYIPIAHDPEALMRRTDPDDLFALEVLNPLPRQDALDSLRTLLEDPTIGKMGHNIKYDLIVFQRAGINLQGIVLDTMVASYLTDPSRLRHNLGEVSLQYLRRKMIPIADVIGKGAKAVTFDKVPVDLARDYSCEDADITWRLSGIFRPLLRERALEALFEEVERPLIDVLARMEMAGIAIDLKVFEALQLELTVRLRSLEAEIFEMAGESFQINSPKQLQGILFDKLKLAPKRKTKTGFSTDVEVLEELAGEHPLPAKLLEYRTLEKLRGTYVEALPRLINPETGRIHTSFNQAVAATGRLSSSDPNLQNIPVRTELGRAIRRGFIADGKDKRLISADYSQIELRILAHLSGDDHLCAAFRDTPGSPKQERRDIHRETAAHIFGVPPDQVTQDMRRQAKAINFGVVYGISAFGLARNTGLSNAEAARFIDQYFTQYPGVRHYMNTVLERAQQDGYVTTVLQRRRYMPELKSADVNTRKGAERAAINTPVQGSAADVIKLAMLQLDEALQHGALCKTGARMLLQVHDELLVEAPEHEAEHVAEVMKEIMENAIELEVPLVVDIGIGNNWDEIH